MKKEKQIIDNKNRITYLEYKNECHKKFIEYLNSCIEINLKLIKIYKDRIDLLNKEEIEVLQE